MTTVVDFEDITRDHVASIARAYSKEIGATFTDQRFVGGEATVVEGSHEGSEAPFIISWEECPVDYVDDVRLNEIAAEVTGNPNVYAEPINHWCVAFFV